MRRLLQPTLILLLILLGACHRPPAGSATVRGRIVTTGLLPCFDENRKDRSGQLVYCETSAVLLDGKTLVFGSDKPIPGDRSSSVFSTRLVRRQLDTTSVTYFAYPAFQQATKYEDFAQTPDGAYLFATTAFDRVKGTSADFDAYNTLLMWKKGNPASVRVVHPSEREGVVSSVNLRVRLATALASPAFPDGPPYFKVEGLACLPGNRLLFGIREVGKSYEAFSYTIHLLETTYQVAGDSVHLGAFRSVYSFEPDSSALNGQRVALSGLAYDPFHNRLYLLTSYESAPTAEGIGGFLWTLSLEALEQKAPPVLVRNAQGKALSFSHKPEGIAVLSRKELFIVYDDDRVLGAPGLRKGEEIFYRRPNQAAYSVVLLE